MTLQLAGKCAQGAAEQKDFDAFHRMMEVAGSGFFAQGPEVEGANDRQSKRYAKKESAPGASPDHRLFGKLPTRYRRIRHELLLVRSTAIKG
jgi:hypothetical protein